MGIVQNIVMKREGVEVFLRGMNLSLIETKILPMFGKRVQPASAALGKKARKLGFLP